MSDVVFPQFSASDPAAEGVVATWFVSDGEVVAEGQLLAEVAVDKVDMEVPAQEAGTVRVLVEEGGIATQGTVIARID